jgi:hypothetical protein
VRLARENGQNDATEAVLLEGNPEISIAVLQKGCNRITRQVEFD